MSDEQLKQLLEEVICNNKILTLENDIFERYLMRRNPQCLQSKSLTLKVQVNLRTSQYYNFITSLKNLSDLIIIILSIII